MIFSICLHTHGSLLGLFQGCDGGTRKVQLFRILDSDSSLANGDGGSFTNQGVLDGCYLTDSYAFLLDFIIADVAADDVRSIRFDGNTCGDGTQQYASVKYYSTETCTGTNPDTVDLNLGVITGGHMLRCWCKSTQAPSGDDGQYDMQSMHAIPDATAAAPTAAAPTTAAPYR